MCVAIFMFVSVAQVDVKAVDCMFVDDPIVISKIEAEPKMRYGFTLIKNMSEEAEIVKVKQSKKIAKITIEDNKSDIYIKPLKTGKATLTVTVKNGSETEVYKIKLTIVKYKNPVKGFKVGGKEYKNKFNKRTFYVAKVPKKDRVVKFRVKTKKGYKARTATYFYETEDGMKAVQVKNGQKFLLRAAKGSFQINLVNKKNGNVDNLVVWYE